MNAKSIHPLLILAGGLGTVVTLAVMHLIVDGETVAALSAVLSATIGTHALERPDA
jgi:hypothetical protein